MRTVSAREANQSFSRILGEAEAGEEFVITRHGRPVATLRAYLATDGGLDRQAAVEHAIRLMENAPAIGKGASFSRAEIYDTRLDELTRAPAAKVG